MSGVPPHHSNNRQPPTSNTTWNHLQVPNYYPRQPQHAHMSNEHPLLHQPTWHTPTTEPIKSASHSHVFNLEQISERPYARHSPGVDLSLQRNGNQNGELPSIPISLSVRDANKINSLLPSAIDISAPEITKSSSSGLKAVSPGIKVSSPALKSSPVIKSPISPGISSTSIMHDKQDSPKNIKRLAKRMDSIIERLNPVLDKMDKTSVITDVMDKPTLEQSENEKPCQSSVIVQPSSYDESSNSSGVVNSSTPTIKDEDVTSPFSNEDSTDSSKSRRKRKPAKTIRMPKELETFIKDEVLDFELPRPVEGELHIERQRPGSAPPKSPVLQPRSRRKTLSESETIANIQAMVESTAPVKEVNCSSNDNPTESENLNILKPISVSVITTKESVTCDNNENETLNIQTSVQKPDTNSFVEVENKLEEMFAGISDDVIEPTNIEKMPLVYNDQFKTLGLEESKNEDSLLKPNESLASTSQFTDGVTSTSNDLNESNTSLLKRAKRIKVVKGRSSDSTFLEVSSKKKKNNKKPSNEASPGKTKLNLKKSKKTLSLSNNQAEEVKDVYSYDSGSNASSSKSRGPFVQIHGSRESPISVSIVNTPMNDEDSDKKHHKSKKYHDDSEYRHKVRSRGLHCSTLSNKYDAQTRDATWICVFCKRGPHAIDPNLTGPSKFNLNTVVSRPGDLFGPYIITSDSPEYHRCLDDPYDQQFRSKKVARAVNAIINDRVIAKKSKRKYSDSYDSRSSLEGNDALETYLGITETKEKHYEVWVHEDCIIWSPSVYLVGPKIVGLEEAVWTSCNVVCSRCRYRGANLCCVKRGCMNVMHFGCAAASNWYLDEENYKALCVAHKAL